MDRAIRRDIEKRYKKISEQFKNSVDKVFCYTCEQCGQVIKVRQVDDGIAPMGIECPYCHASAYTIEEGDTAPNISVTYEWYRPTLDEVLELVDDHMFTVNFILSGGLKRRECRAE